MKYPPRSIQGTHIRCGAVSVLSLICNWHKNKKSPAYCVLTEQFNTKGTNGKEG